LQTCAIAKGYTVSRIVMEVGSGLNESRPKLTALLRDGSMDVIVVEHKDRLTRVGFNCIVTLLDLQGRRVEVVFPNETKENLEADFIASITSISARVYGRRGNRQGAERIRPCVEQAAQHEERVQE
jgi:predicted site-specific integrase-resolvase